MVEASTRTPMPRFESCDVLVSSSFSAAAWSIDTGSSSVAAAAVSRTGMGGQGSGFTIGFCGFSSDDHEQQH